MNVQTNTTYAKSFISGQTFNDGHGHGTHVAGIVAGNGATGETDENGFLFGLGVAPGAGLIGQRIFDGVGGYGDMSNMGTPKAQNPQCP